MIQVHESTQSGRSAHGPRGVGIELAWAGGAQTAAVLTLLPELVEGQARPLPPRFAVAHLAGAPSQLIGAAAFVPIMHHGPSPGFRGVVRVLPAWQRLGVGRALLARIAAEVLAWDVPHLQCWKAEPDGDASGFMRALGFRVDYTLHHFLIDKSVVAPMSRRLVQRLRAGGRVPPGFALMPLHEAPRDLVVALHATEFNAGLKEAAAMLERVLGEPLVRDLSFALWDGRLLAGYLLAGRHTDGLPEVRFWASDPRCRGGWAAALLLEAFVHCGVERGGHAAHYHCNANARAPLNVARRCGARQLELCRGWVLDLTAPPSARSQAPAVPTQ